MRRGLHASFVRVLGGHTITELWTPFGHVNFLADASTSKLSAQTSATASKSRFDAMGAANTTLKGKKRFDADVEDMKRAAEAGLSVKGIRVKSAWLVATS